MADRTTVLINAGSNYGEFQRADGTYGQVAIARRHGDIVLNAVGNQTGFTSGTTVGLTSADLTVGDYDELAVDINLTSLTGGVSPTFTYSLNRKGADGIYYLILTPTAISAAGKIIQHVGKGAAQNVLFGTVLQVLITFTGGPTGAAFTMSILGK